MINRAAVILIALLAAAGLVRGQTTQTGVTPEVRLAVDRSVDFLIERQNADGSFDGGGPKAAMTGLTVLALLSAGNTPDDGRNGAAVSRAVDFLIGVVPADGYVGRVDNSRMYGQGIVTLALAAAAGADPDPDRRQRAIAVVERMTGVILEAQAQKKDPVYTGGWRYEPQSPDSDLSLSGWCVLALRAADGVGVEIPDEPIRAAVAYVESCRDPATGGFRYQPGQPASAAMTAVGTLALTVLDRPDREDAVAGAAFLRAHPVQPQDRFAVYAIYYTTHAAFLAGGETWETVWASTRAQLLSRQMPDGGFPPSPTGEEPGRIYSTAMATLALGVPFRYVPVYQR